jgi:hypothetical protein
MSDGAAAFQVICVKCGALGIVLDYSEGAPLRHRSNVEDVAICGGRSETCVLSPDCTSTILSISVMSNLDRLG